MEIKSNLPLWTSRTDARLAEVVKAAESTRTVATPLERPQEDLESFIEAWTYDRLGKLPSGPNVASDFEILITEQVKRPPKENARPLEQINAELNAAHAGFQELYGKMLRELSGREPVMPDGMVGISVDGQGKIIVRNHNGLLRDDVAQRLSARMNASEELLRYANRYVELAIERVESDMNVNFDGLGRYHLDKENFSSVVTAMEFNSLQGHLLSWGVIRYGYWTEPKLYRPE
ncbi:hypothetical protein [Metapseudomonas otitidis]|uniref:hypothetical protein n=1 Tax=Metapseudomonas otitidis TaxID=319939 RepID=UPI0008EC808E|nr:hypothetical protein [Pseudomonas otitidis]SFA63272.1 hypothetical protein SAMN05216263_112110 [Pseudomonas otitidis]